jgi:hypothetical protein
MPIRSGCLGIKINHYYGTPVLYGGNSQSKRSRGFSRTALLPNNGDSLHHI